VNEDVKSTSVPCVVLRAAQIKAWIWCALNFLMEKFQ
jgi:hypothetical protein